MSVEFVKKYNKWLNATMYINLRYCALTRWVAPEMWWALLSIISPGSGDGPLTPIPCWGRTLVPGPFGCAVHDFLLGLAYRMYIQVENKHVYFTSEQQRAVDRTAWCAHWRNTTCTGQLTLSDRKHLFSFLDDIDSLCVDMLNGPLFKDEKLPAYVVDALAYIQGNIADAREFLNAMNTV